EYGAEEMDCHNEDDESSNELSEDDYSKGDEFNDSEDYSCDSIDTMHSKLKRKYSRGEDGQYECEVCEKKYQCRTSVIRHMRSHQKDEQKRLPYSCEVCKKRFSEKSLLRMHTRIHLTDDDPRKKKVDCKLCGKKFHPLSIYVHMRQHKDKVEERKPYECEKCGNRFSTRTLLANHGKTHLDDPRLEKFHCELCSKIFRSKQALQRHSKSHLDEETGRPFKCEDCCKRFAEHRSLSDHMVTHLDNEDDRKPYKCDQCDIHTPST
ncbi:hypothetical protein PMAYCL1PPCAC_08096, partial [Pristionchus mayeri]